MIIKKIKVFFVVLAIVIARGSIFAVEQATPETITKDTLCPFTINKSGSYGFGSNIYIATSTSGVREFSICQAGVNDPRALRPLSPEKVTFNGNQNQDNPLFDSSVRFLSVMGMSERLAIVRAENEPIVYVIDRQLRPDGTALYAIGNIKDSAGEVASSVVGLTAAEDSLMLVAVTGNKSALFGDSGSGIAACKLLDLPGKETVGKDPVMVRGIAQIDIESTENTDEKIQRAVALDRSSPAITIGSPVTTIENDVSLYWDVFLNLLYVGLKATGGPAQTDGVRGLVLGSVNEKGKIVFQPVIPDSVFVGRKDALVGAVGSQAQIQVHSIHSLYTSTMLNYLIVQGGAVTQETDTRQMVYAFGQVNRRNAEGVISKDDSAIHGTIASKYAIPTDVVSSDEKHRFLGRRFVDAASSSDEMPSATDLAVAVGGGPVDGIIQSLKVRGDAVFVAIRNADQNTSDIFFSRALFDHFGRIKGWTLWARAATCRDSVCDFSVDMQTGNCAIACNINEQESAVRRITWGLGNSGQLAELVTLINKELPSEHGGIQALFDFDMSDYEQNQSSLVVAIGRALVLARVCPTTASTQSLVIQDKQVTELGPISSVEIADKQDGSCLFVGGAHGLSVLVSSDTSDNYSVVDTKSLFECSELKNFSLQKCGNYPCVRKLIADRNQLYVVTDKIVDRIDLIRSDLAKGHVVATKIAGAAELKLGKYGAFFDLLVSEKFALLATTCGAFRIGDYKDIATVTDNYDACWTSVKASTTCESVEKIVGISTTGRAQDVCRSSSGGTIYLLCCSRSVNHAQLYRFSVCNTQTAEISETTLLPVPDRVRNMSFEHNTLYPFRFFGHINTALMDDGAIFLSAIDRHGSQAPYLMNANHAILLEGVESSKNIKSIVRIKATGNWLLAGDFGLRGQ